MTSKSPKPTVRAQKAAAARAEQARKERRRRLLTIGGVIAAMVLIVGGAVAISMVTKSNDDAKLSDAASQSSEFGLVIGEEDAPHSVVVYEDFLCPFCGELERATGEDLAKLAAEGKVRVEYRPFDLLSQAYGDYPIRATNAFAVVLEKSGPQVAQKMHELLFANQPSEKNPDALSDDDLVKLAVKAGAAEEDVRPGIENLSHKDWVTKASADARKSGVSGTPTILVDGKVFEDGRTVDELADNLIAAVS
ncbi:thioredoxin domain-containing protein [Nocardioides sp. zg-536]|uniref:Thioredoxin domain-containing protein n=1 Tax=Nocardioides faecalis TaxID=2803858 RepID=A0A938Y7M1_9ACTN|nr:thioredoxin domain-containing protein [Nocardioides faecalis]MBM9460760.1 thioredoxin domain-containing protein [Nocardioides faecalis]QVI57953.1 thioredoxin domain-containing protein [Nocardioides faecalis]